MRRESLYFEDENLLLPSYEESNDLFEAQVGASQQEYQVEAFVHEHDAERREWNIFDEVLSQLPEAHPQNDKSSYEGQVNTSITVPNTKEDTMVSTGAGESFKCQLNPEDVSYPKEPKSKPKIEREIFLFSKLKKREPRRRSFDLGDMRSGIAFDFAEPANKTSPQNEEEAIKPKHLAKMKQPSAGQEENLTLNYDKKKISIVYNTLVDDCKPVMLSKLNKTEQKLLEGLLRLRLVACKAPVPSSDLLADLPALCATLSKHRSVKKRTEELMKKNFKTTINIMLESIASQHDKLHQLKTTQGLKEEQERFLKHFFGEDWTTFSRIFNWIQMNTQFYQSIFAFKSFRTSFISALNDFESHFIAERLIKTENLVCSIAPQLILSHARSEQADKKSSSNRSPWSLEEARASQKAMLKMVCSFQ